MVFLSKETHIICILDSLRYIYSSEEFICHLLAFIQSFRFRQFCNIGPSNGFPLPRGKVCTKPYYILSLGLGIDYNLRLLEHFAPRNEAHGMYANKDLFAVDESVQREALKNFYEQRAGVNIIDA